MSILSSLVLLYSSSTALPLLFSLSTNSSLFLQSWWCGVYFAAEWAGVFDSCPLWSWSGEQHWSGGCSWRGRRLLGLGPGYSMRSGNRCLGRNGSGISSLETKNTGKIRTLWMRIALLYFDNCILLCWHSGPPTNFYTAHKPSVS